MLFIILFSLSSCTKTVGNNKIKGPIEDRNLIEAAQNDNLSGVQAALNSGADPYERAAIGQETIQYDRDLSMRKYFEDRLSPIK